MAKLPPADVRRYREAVTWMRQQLGMGAKELRAIEESNAARARLLAQHTQLEMVYDAWQRLEKARSDEARIAVREKLAKAWGVEEPWRMDTIVRTAVQKAYSQAAVEQLLFEEHPFWTFSAVLDSRTSELCRSCHGVTLPAAHPWFHTHTPPLHFNCRSRLLGVSEGRARGIGITRRPPKVSAEDGFGGVGEDTWEPDLRDYPRRLVGRGRRHG